MLVSRFLSLREEHDLGGNCGADRRQCLDLEHHGVVDSVVLLLDDRLEDEAVRALLRVIAGDSGINLGQVR